VIYNIKNRRFLEICKIFGCFRYPVPTTQSPVPTKLVSAGYISQIQDFKCKYCLC